MKYRLLIAWEAIEFIEALPRSERQKLRKRLLEICDFPSSYADFYETVESDRRSPVHVFGRYAIHYWEDGADMHVKIMLVTFSDRA